MTESRAVSVVLAVGMLLAGAIALIAFGPLAVNVLLTVAVAALILERTSIFRRLDEVWEDTDKALVNSAAAVEAVEELRGWLVEFRAAFEDEPEQGPTTQPIELPEPQGPPAPDDGGPPTAPADQVLLGKWAEDVLRPTDSDERRAKQAEWVNETLARFDFSGGRR